MVPVEVYKSRCRLCIFIHIYIRIIYVHGSICARAFDAAVKLTDHRRRAAANDNDDDGEEDNALCMCACYHGVAAHGT